MLPYKRALCINKPFHSCKMKVFYVFLILRCFWKNWSTKFKSQEQVFLAFAVSFTLILSIRDWNLTPSSFQREMNTGSNKGSSTGSSTGSGFCGFWWSPSFPLSSVFKLESSFFFSFFFKQIEQLQIPRHGGHAQLGSFKALRASSLYLEQKNVYR